jgi:hypothetical protein
MATRRATAQLSKPDEDGVSDIEGISAVEAQEEEVAGEYVTLPVADTKVRVRPQQHWRMSHLRALNEGDFDTWADGVLHPDDVDEFLDQDITLAEFEVFAKEAAKATGDGLGKSRRPRGSSRNTRKR